MRPRARPDAPQLLAILGWGRSGSTLLAGLLGTADGAFNAGELRWLWKRGLVEGRQCGCGEPVPSCPVWSRVLTRMETLDPGSVDPSVVLPLQDRYALVRRTPRLLVGRMDQGRRRYASVLRTLCRAIQDETGADIIVDSSKRPCDAILLQDAGVDVATLLLVRDPRAVAFSWSVPRPRSDRVDGTPDLMARVGPARSTYRWLQRNLLAELVLWRSRSPHRRVRYEDLVADPSGVVASLAAEIPGLGRSEAIVDRHVELGVQHTVSGNPSRFRTGPVEIRLDDRWVDGLRPGHRRIAAAMGWPLMVRYGYAPVCP